MNHKPIILVAGEPNSIFFEILFKVLKTKRIKCPLILIASHKILSLQMIKLNFKINIKLLDLKKINDYKLNNSSINLINVNYNQKKAGLLLFLVHNEFSMPLHHDHYFLSNLL